MNVHEFNKMMEMLGHPELMVTLCPGSADDIDGEIVLRHDP